MICTDNCNSVNRSRIEAVYDANRSNDTNGELQKGLPAAIWSRDYTLQKLSGICRKRIL